MKTLHSQINTYVHNKKKKKTPDLWLPEAGGMWGGLDEGERIQTSS